MLPARAQAQDAIYRKSHTPCTGTRQYMEYFNITAPDGLNFEIEVFLYDYIVCIPGFI